MKEHRAFAKKNNFGFWVGCIEFPNGVISEVTNAKHKEEEALEIIEPMVAYLNEREAINQEKMQRRDEMLRMYPSLRPIIPGRVS